MIKGRRVFTQILVTIITALTLVTAQSVYADYGTYGAYGSTAPSESILIDKLVALPNGATTKGGTTTYTYVDNLSSNDKRFSPGQEVTFKIKVKNTSSRTLNVVKVKDTLPAYLTFVSGNDTVSAGSFTSGQEKEFIVKARVASQDKLPTDKSIICVANKATAYEVVSTSKGGVDQQGLTDEDTAQFCIEKQVQNVTNVPKAGPEMGFGIVALEMAGLGFGMLIKKRAR